MAKNPSHADLMKDLEKTRSELLDLKLKSSSASLQQTHLLKEKKKAVARILNSLEQLKQQEDANV